jgi:hypothetical protein
VGTLNFHVFDYVRIFSNVEIGLASIDLTSIAPGKAQDMWLTLKRPGETITAQTSRGEIVAVGTGATVSYATLQDESSSEPLPPSYSDLPQVSTKPAIRVFVHVTPLVASNPAKGMRLSSLRMSLDKEIYYPGEIVRGCVIWNVGNPKKTRGVKLQFAGNSLTEWTEHRQYGNVRYVYHYRGYVTYFDRTATLLGCEAGESSRVESATSFFWPFQFILPSHLPCSFKGAWGYINYFVKAFVDIPWASDKAVIIPISIATNYNSIAPNLLAVNSGTHTTGIFVSDMCIGLKISSPLVGYTGEPMTIGVSVDNSGGKKDVKEITVELVQTAVFVANCAGMWQGRTTRTIPLFSKISSESGVAGIPVVVGKQWSGNITIGVPKDLTPTINNNLSPIISVTYSILVTINTVGNFFTSASNKKEIPIYIGRRRSSPPQVAPSPVLANPQQHQAWPPQNQGMPQPFLAPAPSTVFVIRAPSNYYQFLAPSPLVNGEYNVVGTTVPQEAFAQEPLIQPEQWTDLNVPQDHKEVAFTFDPNMAPIAYTLEVTPGQPGQNGS